MRDSVHPSHSAYPHEAGRSRKTTSTSDKGTTGIRAAIMSAMHMQRADDLFGMPNGTPITDRIIEASIQWAERIMQRIDSLHSV